MKPERKAVLAAKVAELLEARLKDAAEAAPSAPSQKVISKLSAFRSSIKICDTEFNR